MVKALLYIILGICIGAFCFDEEAEGDHFLYLPLVPNTPLMQSVIQTQNVIWCVDARGTNYPGFVTQLRDVMNEYEKRVGITHRQVAFSDSSCQVKHTMPDQHGCSGCAAWIYYANWPVVIEYKWQLGYTDWRSAHGHELGHGILGLHERYRDSGGSIGCGGTDEVGLTVMQCGPPHVRYPTPLDVERGCAIIKTSWCGKLIVVTPTPTATPTPTPTPAPCVGQPDVHGNRYDRCNNWWVAPDGNLFLLDVPYPATGQLGWWLFSACSNNGWRYTGLNLTWLLAGTLMFPDQLRVVVKVPAC